MKWLLIGITVIFSSFTLLEGLLTASINSAPGRPTVKKKNPDIQGDDLCVDCIRAKDTLSLEIGHFDATVPSCTLRQVTVTNVMIVDKYGHFCSLSIDNEQVSIPVFRQGIRTFFQNPPVHPPFDLNYRRLAVVEIPLSCMKVTLDSEIGQVFLQLQYLNCNNDTTTTTEVLDYEMGCPDTTGFILRFQQHNTKPELGQSRLPSNILAKDAIELSKDVTIADSTRTLLRVCPGTGYIKARKDTTKREGGVKVEKGAFFRTTTLE
jgi:hypothetical protein